MVLPFLQGRHTAGQKHRKRCSTLLIIREMPTKTIIRHHFTPVRMAITKTSTNNKCWRTCSDKGALLHCLISSEYGHDVIHVSHLYSKIVEAWKLSWEISDTWFRWLSIWKLILWKNQVLFLYPVYLLMGLTHFLRFPFHYRII